MLFPLYWKHGVVFGVEDLAFLQSDKIPACSIINNGDLGFPVLGVAEVRPRLREKVSPLQTTLLESAIV
jgi:hypothetical protein